MFVLLLLLIRRRNRKSFKKVEERPLHNLHEPRFCSDRARTERRAAGPAFCASLPSHLGMEVLGHVVDVKLDSVLLDYGFGFFQAFKVRLEFDQKLVPEMIVGLQLCFFVKEYEAPDVAVTHQTEWNPGDDVMMVDETERPVTELVIEVAGKCEIARARLPEGVQSVYGRVSFEGKPGHRQTGQRRA